MSAFAAAARALFRDRNLSVPALYRAGGDPGATGVAVRVILSEPDVQIEYGGARIVSGTAILEVGDEAVALPAPGDTFEVGAVVHVVTSAPMRDVERLSWRCEVRPE